MPTRLPLPILFFALGALTPTALQAGEIVLTTGSVEAFQGADFVEVNKSVSELLLVTSTATINLTYSFPTLGPQTSDCLFGSNGAICQGTINDFTFVTGSPLYSLNFSGPYNITPGGVVSGTGPLCGFTPADQCNFVLQPGLYTFTTSVYDQLDQQLGATALPFADGFTGLLTFTGGNVQVVTPEPAAAVPMVAAVAIGMLVRRRLQSKRSVTK
jgi:hypothetical protein